MPGLTVVTDAPPARPCANTTSRSSSPTRPPISPITPTLGPTDLPAQPPPSVSNGDGILAPPPPPPAAPLSFAQGRPALTHSQPDQVAVPPPVPVSFDDDNPDVLALKSAISILQLQRAKAARDAQALARAKADALADPASFVADLRAGRVAPEGDTLFPSGGGGGGSRVGRGVSGGVGDDVEMADDDDDDDEEDDDDSEEDGPSNGVENPKSESQDHTLMNNEEHNQQPRKNGAPPRKSAKAPQGERSWHTLPKPQNVVRCPPINWAQYAVVGESLDKLHAEQQRAPALGSPAVVSPGGTYEFRGGAQAGNPGEGLVGIAAPYTPSRDKLEKKAKGRK